MFNNILSVSVHEQPEVVLDMIFNYKYFNPNCGIVLHLSKKSITDQANKKRASECGKIKVFEAINNTQSILCVESFAKV